MLWHRAFVNARSKQGISPLHLSAQNGYNNLVKLLIETHGAAIDALSLVSGFIIPRSSSTIRIKLFNLFVQPALEVVYDHVTIKWVIIDRDVTHNLLIARQTRGIRRWPNIETASGECLAFAG